MKKQGWLVVGFLVWCCVEVFAASPADTITGKWNFSVDFAPPSGGHGEPTFEFVQKDKDLTGTYKGPMGEYKVTGTVTDRVVVFGFDAKAQWDPSQIVRMTFTGKVADGWNDMKGTVQFGNDQKPGEWTAKRAK